MDDKDKQWKTLEDYRDQIWGCARCNWCQNIYSWNVQSARFNEICPSFSQKRFAAYSGMGRMHISRALLEGDFDHEDSPQLLDIANRCTMCGACQMHCMRMQGKEPANVIEALRAELVERGMVMPEHQAYLESTLKYGNPFDTPKKERLRWTEDLDFTIKDLTKEKGEVLLYLGCMYSLETRLRDTTRLFAQILHAAGVDFGFLGAEEKCCGMEQLRIGERGLFEMLAEENIETFNELGIKTLVTPCPHGYYAFKHSYSKVGELNFEVLHFTQYLKRLLDEGKIELEEVPHQVVTYSDPCNLGRWGGEYDAPREILDSIEGIEVREMERTHDEAWCCGAGGGALTAFPDFATASAEERVAEAEASEASVLVAACPWCEYNFEDGIENTKSNMELHDIAAIVFKAMKKNTK
jgi:Fe-S oxidoreductase